MVLRQEQEVVVTSCGLEVPMGWPHTMGVMVAPGVTPPQDTSERLIFFCVSEPLQTTFQVLTADHLWSTDHQLGTTGVQDLCK